MSEIINEILSHTESRMEKTKEVLRRDLAGIRTGRASPAFVKPIKVEYEGMIIPLEQLAMISVPEPRLIVIQPWDKNAIPAIEKAILKSDLGVTPVVDGMVIRLPLPELTEERRRELVKLVNKRVEEARIAVRNIRRDALEEIREKQRNKEISEDEARRAQNQLQKITDKFIEALNKLGKEKEAELMEL